MNLKRRPRTWSLRVQRGRHVLQLSIAAFISFIVAQRLIFPESSGIVLPSGEAFCPFGGFESAYRWITSGGTYIPHTHASNLVLGVAVVLTAVVAKGFFCGWICPLGALQEAIAALSHTLQRRVPWLRRGVRALQRRADRLAWIDRWLRYLKYVVLLWALAGAAVFGSMVFRDVDPWVAIVNVAELEASLGAVTLAIVLIASLFVERPWCRYACPLGATIGLLGRLSPLKIERDSSACLACNVCTTQCPVGIQVHQLSRVESPDCISCLQCVGACPSEGGLALKLALPGLPRTSPIPVPSPEPLRTPERTGQRIPRAVLTQHRWRSFAVKPLLFAGLGLLMLFSPIWAAQAAGFWTTSGRLTGTGQLVVPTGRDPSEVRGWMTVQQLVDAYGVRQDELYTRFGVPAETPASTPLSTLEQVAPGFSTATLRTWLAEQSGVAR